jgi:hypothetical protein
MDPMIRELRHAIYSSRQEFNHFRQVLVNAVMTTDLDLHNDDANSTRSIRWGTAFYNESQEEETAESAEVTAGMSLSQATSASASTSSSRKKCNFDRKATLVLQCIMQVSIISFTMRHWYVFQKWNTASKSCVKHNSRSE